MRQFIKNNKPYQQTERNDFAEKFIYEGAIEIPVLYSKNFISPIWNGTDFIEDATPEEIKEQENQQKQQLKRQAYEELLPTDWYVVRFIETGIAIPQEILDQRQAIRNKYE